MPYLIALSLAFIFSFIFTIQAKKIALKYKIVDSPAPRKIHQKPIPLLGGTAIFLAFSLTALIFWQQGLLTDQKISNLNILAILLGGLILIIGGYFDDRYNLKPAGQFIFPVLATIIILVSGIKIEFITNPLGGILQVSATLGVSAAFFWILGMIYTTKLLDGLDGLVSGITAISALIIYLVSLSWDVAASGTSFLALILAGSCLGFLIFNWHPAKIFLGEGGSVFCGFLLGVLAIISGSKIATALLIMGVPVLDVAWVIIRRIRQGLSPIKADSRHLHFRLLDIGLTHRGAVMFLYLISAAFGLASLFLPSVGKIIALGVLISLMIIFAGSLVIVYKFKKND